MRAQILLVLGLVGLAFPVSAQACSFFLAARDGRVLAANNEDWEDPYVDVHFFPAGKQGFGWVKFGFGNGFPQGGMNDKGLFFDGAATPYLKIEEAGRRPALDGNIIVKAMRECADVEQVIALFKRYNLALLERAQLMFGDKRGDAVIIEGDVMIRKRGSRQICTNFYQSRHRTGPKPCRRYLGIDAVLEKAETLSVETMRQALIAGHQKGRFATVYSNIYDLESGRIILYQFHDFETPVELDLAAELKKGERLIDMATLFPRNPKLEARRKSFRRPISHVLIPTAQREGVAAAIEEHERLWKTAPDSYRFGEVELLTVAVRLYRDEGPADAEAVLRWMVKGRFSKSARAYYYLGECRLKAEDRAEARRAFKTALALDPKLEAARRRLASLRAY